MVSNDQIRFYDSKLTSDDELMIAATAPRQTRLEARTKAFGSMIVLGKKFVKGWLEGSNSQAGSETLLKHYAISKPAVTYYTIERCVRMRMILVRGLSFCRAHETKGLPTDASGSVCCLASRSILSCLDYICGHSLCASSSLLMQHSMIINNVLGLVNANAS